MKKSILITAVAALAMAFTFEQSTWSVDKAHSQLGFTINHLGLADVYGNFKNVETKITTSKEDFSDAAVELSAEVASISTGIEARDNHLKAADMLDAEKHPKLTFKSTSFTKKEGKNYELKGDFTLHGVTKPVVLKAVFNGTATHPYTKQILAGFKVTGVIKRSDFGIAPTTPAPVLSDEIQLIADLEFTKN